MKHDAIMLMGRIHDLTQKWLRGELAAAGLSGIVPSHGDVLALLFMKGEATMHELAAFAHRTKPTTTVLVDKLEEMGLVRRSQCSASSTSPPRRAASRLPMAPSSPSRSSGRRVED